MTKDKDILKLIKLLRYRSNFEIADLLINSNSNLDESSTYGSRWNSVLSRFEILSPIENHTKLNDLSNEKKSTIFKSVLEMYPLRDGCPEITEVMYIPDLDLDSAMELVVPSKLVQIDFAFIQEQIEKCKNKINIKDFNGAVTNSRALVESICFYILESKGIIYEDSGDLINLFKVVRKSLKMNPEDYENANLKQIISGTISIINGIAGIRNSASDAHGTSPSRHYKISERHAILCVNLSKSVSEYLYASLKKTD